LIGKFFKIKNFFEGKIKKKKRRHIWKIVSIKKKGAGKKLI